MEKDKVSTEKKFFFQQLSSLKLPAKNQYLKIQESIKFVEEKMVSLWLQFFSIPKKLTEFGFLFFKRLFRFLKSKVLLTFLALHTVGLQVLGLQQKYSVFSLIFLMQYNKIQGSPKSFYLFTYLSSAVNAVESKR